MSQIISTQFYSKGSLAHFYKAVKSLVRKLSGSLLSFVQRPWASLAAQTVKNLPAVQEIQLGREGLLEVEMATHSSMLAWRIPTDRGAWQATVHGVEKGQT